MLSHPYLASIKTSLIPLALLGIAVRSSPGRRSCCCAAAACPPSAGTRAQPGCRCWRSRSSLGVAVRPYVQTAHANLNAPTRAAMAVWQRADGLPIQPTRLY